MINIDSSPRCSSCGSFLVIGQNWYEGDSKRGRFRCKDCIKRSNRNRILNMRISNPKRAWVYGALLNHRKSGCEIDITRDELYEYIKDKNNCEYCGIELDWTWNGTTKVALNHASLDRRSAGGKVELGNIALVCFRCNSSKGQLSAEEFIASGCKRMKKCNWCGELKPVESFFRNNKGYCGKCIPCWKEYYRLTREYNLLMGKGYQT